MDYQFCAEITEFKVIHNVLKAISFKEYAIMRPLEEGLKVTIDEMRCVETSAYLPVSMFSSFHVDTTQEVKFKISLKVFTECLSVFGDDNFACLKLSYKEHGSPLYLMLKHSEENITVDCEIKTLEVDEFTEISLADQCTLNKVVVNAAPLVEALSDLDTTSDELELTLSPEFPFFRITTSSVMGESQMDISKNSEMVVLFQCKATATTRYAFSNIKRIFKVMACANKVSISTGDSGLLGIQMVVTVEEKELYVEYYVSALYLDAD